MTTFDAVYRDGAFYPVAPLTMTDGTAVRVTVVPAATATPPLDPAEVYARVKRIADLPMEPGGDPTVTGRDHDKTLY